MTLRRSAWALAVISTFSAHQALADGLTEDEHLKLHPPAPIGLTARRTQDGNEICWQAVSPPAGAAYDRRVKRFNVYRMSAPATGSLAGWTGTLCYLDRNPGHTRNYAVKAEQQSGELSEFSNTVAAP